MNLLEDLKKSILNFNFIMNDTIHKILVSIKNHLFKEDHRLLFFKNINFFIIYKNRKFKS